MSLYSAVSSPSVHSKHFTLCPPDRPVHFGTDLSSFTQLSELGRHGENDNAQASKQFQRGFEPGLPRLRLRRSTTELPQSIVTL